VIATAKAVEARARTTRIEWAPIALPTLALFIWLVALGFAMDMDPDEGVYKVVEVGIFDGKWPYRDLFTNRQPVTFLWYLPFGLGASVFTQRIVAAAFMAASVPLIAVVAHRWLGPDRQLMAASVYAVLLANPLLSIRGNVEAYLLPLLVGAVAIPAAAPAGLLFGLAIMTKLHALIFAPMFVLLWRRALPTFFSAAGAACLLASLPFVPIWNDYRIANIDFAFAYADYTADDRLRSLGDVKAFIFIAVLPLVVAGAIGGLLRRRDAVLVSWAICGIASVKASGYDYDHYYALMMPPLALLASEGLLYVRRVPSWRFAFIPLTFVGLLVFGAASFFAFSSTGPRPYERLGHLAAGKSGEVYMLGDRADFYVYADRQPERQYFFSIPLVMREDWGTDTRAELLACPPDVLVVPHPSEYVVGWLKDVEQMYAVREDDEFGSVFTDPTPATRDGKRDCR
jgi:hypothetical protein